MNEKMNLLPLIEKKKRGGQLSFDAIRDFTDALARGAYEDYQVAALLMAIRLAGFSEEETTALTVCMASGGKQMDLSALSPTADKHSTGGVSDSTTFVYVPLAALLGFRVAKMSGRALGFTGGTIDKLESFPGYRVQQSTDDFYRIATECGAALVSATDELAPADRVLYALRDVTGTVDSLPLIASSVMSKKLAAGADIIVLDVKYGSGALMKKRRDAERLARLMVEIGNNAGRKTGALVTSMQQPLGGYVGCNAECLGAIEVLKGRRNDLYRVARALVIETCKLAGKKRVSESDIDALIDSGAAYEKFCEMIRAHGGTIPERFEFAPVTTVIRARLDGKLCRVDTEEIGRVNVLIGGGRTSMSAPVRHDVGIRIFKRLGERVAAGEPLAEMYTVSASADAEKRLQACFCIGKRVPKDPLIACEVL